MANKVKKEFLAEHFRKHDSITLYKPDGTPVTFGKQCNITLRGGGTRFVFKNYGEFFTFCKEKNLSLNPIIPFI